MQLLVGFVTGFALVVVWLRLSRRSLSELPDSIHLARKSGELSLDPFRDVDGAAARTETVVECAVSSEIRSIDTLR